MSQNKQSRRPPAQCSVRAHPPAPANGRHATSLHVSLSPVAGRFVTVPRLADTSAGPTPPVGQGLAMAPELKTRGRRAGRGGWLSVRTQPRSVPLASCAAF